MQPVRFAVIGGDGAAASWLAAIRACPAAELLAVSDRDGATAAALAAQYRIAGFDDHRTLLAQSAPDAVVLAISPAGAEKLLGPIAERGAAALLDAPPARTFEEAAAHVARFDAAGKPLHVVSGWRLDESRKQLRQPEADIGRVVQAQARVHAPWPDPLAWRGDRLRAGGGVLISEAYDAVDAVVHAMGLPSDVLAQIGRLGPIGSEPYDNEDSAAVLLRYADGRAATVTARWGATLYEADLWLIGASGSAHVTLPDPFRRAARRSARGGEHLQPPLWSDDLLMLGAVATGRAMRQTAAVAAMVRALRGPAKEEKPPFGSTLRAHLATLAVLETCYLSARTAVPEAPHLVFERAGVPLPTRGRATATDANAG